MTFRERHDGIAHQRQKKLAQLLCLFDVALVSACAVIMVQYQWNPEPTRIELLVLIAEVGLSWLALLVAAGVIGWLADLPTALRLGPSTARPAVDEAFLNKHRMSFFYVGVILNLMAFATVTEITGGMAESPFTALLIAFVLTAEQLSRFKSQATVMLGVGIIVVVLMIGLEGEASIPPNLAPTLLYVAVGVSALVGGGLLTISEKPRNHYVHKLADPSQVLVYRDAHGNWRFSLYDAAHRQDPILLATDGTVAREFPKDLEKRVIECAADMVPLPSWKRDHEVPGWPATFTTCFSLELPTRGTS